MLHIGLFPFIDFMALSLLIPAAFWTTWQHTAHQTKRRSQLNNIRIYYDQDCGFCLKMCLVLRTFLLPDSVQILPAQSYAPAHSIMERENSWVVVGPENETYTHWRAMAYLFSQCWPFRPVGWLMSRWPLLTLGNRVYRWVADNRDRMGNLTQVLLAYRTVRTQPTIAGALVAGFFFYIVTMYNIYELPQLRGHMPEHVRHVAKTARIDQRWDMFAPYPLTRSAYVLMPGKLRNGETVNLYPLTSGDTDWQAPSHFYSLYDGYRWRKYLGRVDGHSNNTVRQALGSYLCRSYNTSTRQREEQLATLEIIFVKFQTNTTGEPKKESRRRVWRHWCFPEYADEN